MLLEPIFKKNRRLSLEYWGIYNHPESMNPQCHTLQSYASYMCIYIDFAILVAFILHLHFISFLLNDFLLKFNIEIIINFESNLGIFWPRPSYWGNNDNIILL